MTSTLRNRPRTLHGNSNVGRWNNFIFLSFLLYYPIYALSLSLSLNKQTNDVKLSYIYIYPKGEREEEHVETSKQKTKKSNYILEGNFLNCLEEYRNQEKGKVGAVVDDYK